MTRLTHRLLLVSCLLALVVPVTATEAAPRARTRAKPIAKLRKARPRPAQPTQRIEAISRQLQRHAGSWRGYQREFRSNTGSALRKSASIIKEAKRNGHPYPRYLERVGVRVGRRLPSLRKIFEKHDAILKRAATAAKVGERGIMRPARILGNDKGELIAARYGDAVPIGYKGYRGVAPLRFVLKMMKDGLFPVGEHNFLGSTPQLSPHATLFVHDMAHHAMFVDRPQVMSAMRKAATRLYDRRVGNPNPAVARFNHFLETAEVVDKKHLPLLRRTLSLPARKAGHRYHVAEVERHLSSLTTAQLRQTLAAVSKLAPKVIDPVGGSVRDVVQLAIRSKLPDNGFSQYVTLTYYANRARMHSTGEVNGSRREIISNLAKLQTGLIEATRLDPAKWVTSVVAGDKLSPRSEIYRFIVNTGVIPKSSPYYKVHANVPLTKKEESQLFVTQDPKDVYKRQ